MDPNAMNQQVQGTEEYIYWLTQEQQTVSASRQLNQTNDPTRLNWKPDLKYNKLIRQQRRGVTTQGQAGSW